MKRKAEESKEVANKAAKRHQQRQQLYFAALDYEKNYIERIDLSSARSPLVDHEWYLGKCLWPPRKMTSYQEMFQLVSRRYFPKNQYTSLAKLVAVYAQVIFVRFLLFFIVSCLLAVAILDFLSLQVHWSLCSRTGLSGSPYTSDWLFSD